MVNGELLLKSVTYVTEKHKKDGSLRRLMSCTADFTFTSTRYSPCVDRFQLYKEITWRQFDLL